MYVRVQNGAKVSLLASPCPQPKMAHHEGQNVTQLSLTSGLQPQTWVKKTCNYNKATAAVWSIYPTNTCMYVCKDPLWDPLWGVHPLDWQCNYNQLGTKVLTPLAIFFRCMEHCAEDIPSFRRTNTTCSSRSMSSEIHACAIHVVTHKRNCKAATKTPRGQEQHHVNKYTLMHQWGQAKWLTGG